MGSRDELELIARWKTGDRTAFGALYDGYVKKIYDFIYYKTHHRETAQDLTSDAFMKALAAVERFDVVQGTFQSWLYRIARNTVIDYYRTKKEVQDVDDVWDLSDDTDIVRDTETRLKLEEVEKYLQKLKSEQRDIIIMRVWQDLSFNEIAEVMGKQEGAVKMGYSRAIRQLRKEMPLAVFISLVTFFEILWTKRFKQSSTISTRLTLP